MMLLILSISIASGPKRGSTKASTGKDLLPTFSVKRIHPRTSRGVPSALCNDMAPGGMGKMRLLRYFPWLLSMNIFAIQGISVAESIVS